MTQKPVAFVLIFAVVKGLSCWECHLRLENNLRWQSVTRPVSVASPLNNITLVWWTACVACKNQVQIDRGKDTHMKYWSSIILWFGLNRLLSTFSNKNSWRMIINEFQQEKTNCTWNSSEILQEFWCLS